MVKPIDFSYEGDIAVLYKGFLLVGHQPGYGPDEPPKLGYVRAYRNITYFDGGIRSYESTHFHLVYDMIEEASDAGEFTEEQFMELQSSGKIVGRVYKSIQEALGTPVYEVLEEPGEFIAEVPGPTGTCYPDAWRFLIKEEEGYLVHGSVVSYSLVEYPFGLPDELRRIGHAWVETETGYIWEPQTKRFYTKGEFEGVAKPIEERRYTATEAAIMAARTSSHGPWTDEDRRMWL